MELTFQTLKKKNKKLTIQRNVSWEDTKRCAPLQNSRTSGLSFTLSLGLENQRECKEGGKGLTPWLSQANNALIKTQGEKKKRSKYANETAT